MTAAKKKAPAKRKSTAKKAARKENRRRRINNLSLLIKAACRRAEVLLSDASGKDKRDWVVALLNAKIDMPVLNEAQEKAVLGLMVDIVCDLALSPATGLPPSDYVKAAQELEILLGDK
tara:strand:+ start:29047 stop:29403 length:357 start_codon:yes stop_codon:yes gene_type:complete